MIGAGVPLIPASPHWYIEVIRLFTPNWFTVSMGTGITALVLNTVDVPVIVSV